MMPLKPICQYIPPLYSTNNTTIHLYSSAQSVSQKLPLHFLLIGCKLQQNTKKVSPHFYCNQKFSSEINGFSRMLYFPIILITLVLCSLSGCPFTYFALFNSTLKLLIVLEQTLFRQAKAHTDRQS